MMGIHICKNLFLLIALLSLNSLAGQKNTLVYDGTSYPIVKGMEEVFKNKTNHSASQLNLTDGKFYQTQVWLNGTINLIYRARNANVWMYVDLYAPGDKGITAGSYQYKPRKTNVNTDDLKGIHFFKKGKIAIDLNGNGKLEKKVEFFTIEEGFLKIEVLGEKYALDFKVTLENNKNVSGNFIANFDQL